MGIYFPLVAVLFVVQLVSIVQTKRSLISKEHNILQITLIEFRNLTKTRRSVSYFDLFLDNDTDERLQTKIYNKPDEFSDIVWYSYLCNDTIRSCNFTFYIWIRLLVKTTNVGNNKFYGSVENYTLRLFLTLLATCIWIRRSLDNRVG